MELKNLKVFVYSHKNMFGKYIPEGEYLVLDYSRPFGYELALVIESFDKKNSYEIYPENIKAIRHGI